MKTFVPVSREFAGGFTVDGAIDAVFVLFSPLGERAWVPGWDPELLHPPGVDWARGQIFRTQEEKGDAVWVVTRLDRDAHDVEYHRVEPGRYVARVRVKCEAGGDATTKVRTAYAFVGLSREGNAEIEGMSAQAYTEKMQRWERWIRARGRR